MELIAVIAILGILAALAVPRFVDVLASSKEKACTANVKLIQDAANLYATHELTPTQLEAGNIISTLKETGYLQDGKFFCPVNGASYILEGSVDTGYTVTCPNGCDGQI